MIQKKVFGDRWYLSWGFVAIGILILALNSYGYEFLFHGEEPEGLTIKVLSFFRWVAWSLIGVGVLGICTARRR